MKTKLTPNRGESETRHAILRKMKQLERPFKGWDSWNELRTYIKGMAKRASKKKGGFGRK